jgi:uncharacterized protein YggE
MTIAFSHVADTTKLAKEEVDRKVQQALSILKELGVEENNIKTISLSYDIEIEYQNGRSVLVGQRAQQSIIVTIYDIKTNTERLPDILDKIAAIDKVVVHNINFDIQDKTTLFIKARELAYQKALDKAKQFAELSGLKIIKPLAITESGNRNMPFSAQNNVMYAAVASSADSIASVPTGEQEISSEITVVFLLK